MTSPRSRLAARLGVVAAAATAIVLGTALPALAHVKVSADKPQAGATDVTVQFDAESESDAAGARQVQVQLPAGIAPTDVSYVSGPAGWTLTQTADGYTVGGNTLAVHKDIIYRVKIAKLPVNATSLAFKSIVTYGNGDADRWIELQQPGQAEPEHPAPVLALEPAAGGAPSTAPSSAAPAPTTAAATTPAAASTKTNSGGSSATLWWILAAVVVVIVAGTGIWYVRRRRAT
jgi:uncharacterized protein YcnI